MVGIVERERMEKNTVSGLLEDLRVKKLIKEELKEELDMHSVVLTNLPVLTEFQILMIPKQRQRYVCYHFTQNHLELLFNSIRASGADITTPQPAGSRPFSTI
ncbi:hypothetical protein CRENBAI_009180 [Crenichthys baileyi]|uniref:Uncharacterized protein n=1 Tax=Crenichthys baileyi TaxID=28760 RepID=A0AAV9SKP6_9TELE